MVAVAVASSWVLKLTLSDSSGDRVMPSDLVIGLATGEQVGMDGSPTRQDSTWVPCSA